MIELDVLVFILYILIGCYFVATFFLILGEIWAMSIPIYYKQIAKSAKEQNKHLKSKIKILENENEELKTKYRK